MLRVLLSDHDSDFALRLGPAQVVGAIDSQELVGMGRDQGIPALDIARGSGVDIAFDEPEGLMKDRRSGILELLKFAVLKSRWIPLPRENLAVVERQQTHHVDDRGLADHVDGEPRVVGRAGKKAEPVAAYKRR